MFAGYVDKTATRVMFQTSYVYRDSDDYLLETNRKRGPRANEDPSLTILNNCDRLLCLTRERRELFVADRR